MNLPFNHKICGAKFLNSPCVIPMSMFPKFNLVKSKSLLKFSLNGQQLPLNSLNLPSLINYWSKD